MFGGVRKKRSTKSKRRSTRRRSPAQIAAAKRMKACARWWTGQGSYQKYMKSCLKTKGSKA